MSKKSSSGEIEQKIKSVTLTLGSSSHYFKSSASVTVEDVTDSELVEVRKYLEKQYLKVLATELKLTSKFADMDLEEVREYVTSRLKPKSS